MELTSVAVLCSDTQKPSPDKEGGSGNDRGLSGSMGSCSSPVDTMETCVMKSNLTWVLPVPSRGYKVWRRQKLIAHIKS